MQAVWSSHLHGRSHSGTDLFTFLFFPHNYVNMMMGNYIKLLTASGNSIFIMPVSLATTKAHSCAASLRTL